jgi:hypothetical protein
VADAEASDAWRAAYTGRRGSTHLPRTLIARRRRLRSPDDASRTVEIGLPAFMSEFRAAIADHGPAEGEKPSDEEQDARALHDYDRRDLADRQARGGWYRIAAMVPSESGHGVEAVRSRNFR